VGTTDPLSLTTLLRRRAAQDILEDTANAWRDKVFGHTTLFVGYLAKLLVQIAVFLTCLILEGPHFLFENTHLVFEIRGISFHPVIGGTHFKRGLLDCGNKISHHFFQASDSGFH
jgi:hypothetical protein